MGSLAAQHLCMLRSWRHGGEIFSRRRDDSVLFTEEDFTCSITIKVCGSAFRESCYATTGLIVCFVVCSAAGCSGMGGVGVIGV